MNENCLLQSAFDGWQIESVLGEGAYGKVYLASRSEFGTTYYSAIKHVGIPKDEAAIHAARSEGDVTAAVMGDYFDDIMEVFIKEIRMMYELKGNTNIVSYEDHKVLKRKNAVGYDIFIRMEKLDSVSEIILQRELTQTDVVKLGIDICRALEVLAGSNLIPISVYTVEKNGPFCRDTSSAQPCVSLDTRRFRFFVSRQKRSIFISTVHSDIGISI